MVSGRQVNYVRQVMRHVDAAHAAGLPAIISRNEKATTANWPGPSCAARWRRWRCTSRPRACSRATAWPPTAQRARSHDRLPGHCQHWRGVEICAPDMGTHAVLDRFRQIEPKVLISVDGVSYGGRDHDRTGVLAELACRAAQPAARAAAGQPGCGVSDSWLRKLGKRYSPK